MFHPLKGILLRLHRRLSRVPVDASRHPAELYYAQVYLDTIGRQLSDLGTGLKILSAGCGTGRLAVPMARLGHRVTGVDYHHDSLRIARQNLDAAGADAELIEADLTQAMPRFADQQFDAVLAIESLYVIETYEKVLDELTRVVRPGGMLFITHRTRYYYLLHALMNGYFDDLVQIAQNSSGYLHKGMHRTFHHWETRAQIQQAYTSRGLTLMALHGIGPCSGFGGDPFAAVCDPGKLDDEQRRLLHMVESSDDDLLMASRYVLAVVRKPE